jgi:hypothetical protein
MTVEIPLRRKYLEHINGHHKSSSGTSGANKHRGETDKKRKEAAMAATRANQRVLVLVGGRKRSWVRAADL